MSTDASESAKLKPWLAIFTILVALSAPLVQRLLVPWFASTFEHPLDRFFSLWVFWLALFLSIGIAHFVEGVPLASMGFQFRQKSLRALLIELNLTVIVALLTGTVVIFFSQYVRMRLTGSPIPSTLDQVGSLPWWLLIPAWVTGAFTEEVLFRSYPIERLIQLTGSKWLAALVTLTAFVGLHLLAWDWIHVLTAVLPLGIMLTLYYLWRRSLVLNVLIHAILLMPLLIAPLIEPYL